MNRTPLCILVVGILCQLLLARAWADEPVRAGRIPQVGSAAVVVLDARTGDEIFSKSANEARAIASTTKIFVAMVVRRHRIRLAAWSKILRADADAARGGARSRLPVNESFRNEDLLRAMLISSDNRAPTALGRAVGLDRKELVREMNKLARRLRLRRTHFIDPSGLRGNTSTARDMALALRTALRDPVIREIMGDAHETIRSKNGSASIDYRSTNHPLLEKRYAVVGGKTGYTRAAGYCFVAMARFGNREVVMAFLGARGKAMRFSDFARVAAWLERGAPGSPRSRRSESDGSGRRARLANTSRR